MSDPFRTTLPSKDNPNRKSEDEALRSTLWSPPKPLASPDAETSSIGLPLPVTPTPGSMPRSVGDSIPSEETSAFPEERYVLQGEFARGGLGRISKAFDKRMQREVAIKELLRASHTEAEARFLREAWITAKLEHPAIVPVHDLGRWRSGASYYTMKLINGRSFYQAIRETQSLSERLALLPHAIDVCEALAYAHSLRIIHRDLKPHNVLIGAFGETVVIDWGLAKELGNGESGIGNRENTEKTEGQSSSSIPHPPFPNPSSMDLTKTGAVMGTPAYMPVEQAQGKPADERADVYSLGAILYHLLSGRPPYQEEKSIKVLAKLLASAPTPLEALAPQLPKDLLAIVHKAMARDPKDRYPTAKELAEDLKKFQAGSLVSVHRYTSLELAKRFLEKNKTAVRVGALLLAVLVVVVVLGYQRLLQENDNANRGWKSASEKALSEQSAKEEEQKQRKRAEEAELEQKRLTQERTFELIENRLKDDPASVLPLLKELSQYPDFQDPSFAGWAKLRALAAEALSLGVPLVLDLKKEPSQTLQVHWLSRSPDGGLLLAACSDHSLRLWETKTWTMKRLVGHTGAVTQAYFSKDARSLVSFSMTDRTIRLWDLSTSSSKVLSEGHDIKQVAFSPEKEQIVSVGIDRIVRLFRFTGEVEERAGHTQEITRAAFSREGDLLATAGRAGDLILWDLATGGKQKLPGKLQTTQALSFSPDGRYLAVGGFGAIEAQLFDLKTNRVVDLVAGTGSVEVVAYSSDGALLALGSTNGDVRLFQKEKLWKTLSAQHDQIFQVAFSSDGALLAAASADKTIQLFDLRTDVSRLLRGHQNIVSALTFLSDGATLASAGHDGTVRIWDTISVTGSVFVYQKAPLVEPTNTVWVMLAASPDGERFATGGETGIVHLWDVKTKEAIALGQSETKSPMGEVAFSPDGRAIASVSDDGMVRLWDIETRTHQVVHQHGDKPANSVAFSPDGRYLASVGGDALVWVKDLKTGEERALFGHTANIWSVSFSPKSDALVTASKDQTVRVWRLLDGTVKTLRVGFTCNGAVFWKDGARVAMSGQSNDVELWEVETEKKITALQGHKNATTALALSPQGGVLASAGGDRSVRLWDLRGEKSRPILLESFPSRITYLTATTVAVTTINGMIHTFRDDLPYEAPEFLAWLSGVEKQLLKSTP